MRCSSAGSESSAASASPVSRRRSARLPLSAIPAGSYRWTAAAPTIAVPTPAERRVEPAPHGAEWWFVSPAEGELGEVRIQGCNLEIRTQYRKEPWGCRRRPGQGDHRHLFSCERLSDLHADRLAEHREGAQRSDPHPQRLALAHRRRSQVRDPVSVPSEDAVAHP